jgi:hypothetical protein
MAIDKPTNVRRRFIGKSSLCASPCIEKGRPAIPHSFSPYSGKTAQEVKIRKDDTDP